MFRRSQTVSSVLLAAAAGALERHGIGSAELQRHTGLTEAMLLDPSGRIPAEKYFATMSLVWQQPIPREVLQAELLLGLQYWPTMVALLTNAPNALTALNNAIQFAPLVADCDALRMHVEQDVIVLSCELDRAPDRSSACAYFLLASMASLVRLYLAGRCSVRSLQLAGKPFVPVGRLRDAFPCEVRFHQPVNRLVVHTRHALSPSEYHNPILYRYSLQQAREEIQRLAARHSHAERVAQWLRNRLALIEQGVDLGLGGSDLQEHACEQFGWSRWTLQRRLGAENTSFTELLNRVREEEARLMLCGTNLSLAEISERLGFSAPSVFSRFFSLRHGMSARDYREERRSQGRAGNGVAGGTLVL